MVIQTISKDYKVIRTLSGSSQVEAYLCREHQKESEECFLVMGLMGEESSQKIVPYFMELSARKEISDFLDSFINNGSLWVVFRYYNDLPLSKKMSEHFSAAARLEASHSLMEKILSQNLPHYLQYEVLNTANLVLSEENKIVFNYLLKNPECLIQCGMGEVQNRLADCFEMLFALEIEERISLDLNAFIDGLRDKEYADYLGIYLEYRRLYEILARLSGEGNLKSKGLLVDMWKGFQRIFKKLWKLLAAALIIGILVLLIYLIIKPKAMPASRIEFERIGTLPVQNIHIEEEVE